MDSTGDNPSAPAARTETTTMTVDPVARTRELRELSKRLYEDEAQRNTFHTSFAPFGRLSKQLQQKIFRLAVPEPEIVPIEFLTPIYPPKREPRFWHPEVQLFHPSHNSEGEEAEIPLGVIEIRRGKNSKVSGLFGANRLSRAVILETHNYKIECNGALIRFSLDDIVVFGLGDQYPFLYTFPGLKIDRDYSGKFADIYRLAVHDKVLDSLGDAALVYFFKELRHYYSSVHVLVSSAPAVKPLGQMTLSGNLQDMAASSNISTLAEWNVAEENRISYVKRMNKLLNRAGWFLGSVLAYKKTKANLLPFDPFYE